MARLSQKGAQVTDLVLEIFRLNRLILESGDKLTRPVGLTSARWQVLGVVEHGPVPVANVGRIMGMSRQSVQQTADSLEEDGLIEYHDNPHHRRAKLMSLTPKGRKALDFVIERQAEWANHLGAKHALEDLQKAVAVLHELRATLEPEAPPTPDWRVPGNERK